MSPSPSKARGLGRGFSSLLSEDLNKDLVLSGSSDRVEKIALDKLQPNPNQPRRHFDEKALNELATSIKHHGIIQPLVITPLKDGKYTIIAGERRWRAAQIAQLSTVPAIIRSTKELEQLEIALIENVQRVDLNPLEQAASILKLHDQFSMTLEQIAKRLGKATSTISNISRLAQLPEKAKVALLEGKITEGHARAILALNGDDKRQDYLLKIIVQQGWSVRQAERFVVSIKEGIVETKKAKARTLTETPETRLLSKKLDTKVRLTRMAYGGKLEISFDSDEDLVRIINLFK
ncbi:MAG TPA: ParB/RepB/Spo0J family partition protein [Candidatus Sulfotelmatobacter sp.]|nr:ParB/RepB/Spo0J family partition protein [Candidatus Sulfotelmatobacter sp.]